MSSGDLQKLLERFPNSAKLLRACQQKRSADGSLAKAAAIGADAEQRLAAENIRLLKAKALLSAIEQRAKDGWAEEAMAGDTATPLDKSVGQSAGALCNTVLKAIQVMKASQRLQLPEKLLPKPAADDQHAAAGPSAPCHGSNIHLLGVTPADILADLPDPLSIKAAAKALMPQVEASLTSGAREFAQALQDIFPSADPTTDVGELLSTKVAEAAQLRQAEAAAFGECVREGTAQLASLQVQLEVLLKLLDGCKTERQATVYKVHAQYKLDHIKALTKKAEHAEKALLMQTYASKGMLPALQQVAALVRATHAEASANLTQLRSQLAAYEELGPEFDAVVREYDAVQGELQRTSEHVRRMLAFQQELEAEAEGRLLG